MIVEGEERKIHYLKSDDEKHGQIRLPRDMIRDGAWHELYFSEDKRYRLSLEKWNELPIVENTYRIVRLAALEMITRKQVTPIIDDSSCSVLYRETVKKFQNIRPVSFYYFNEEAATCLDLIDYTSYVTDYMIYTKEVGAIDDVMKQWARYVNRYAKSRNHALLSCLFIMSYVTTKMKKSDDVIESWIEMESFIFRQCEIDVDEMKEILMRHLKQYRRNDSWQQYTIDDQYWCVIKENYVISCLWIFEPEFSSIVKNINVSQGRATIDKVMFMTAFLPALYRYMLRDIVWYAATQPKLEVMFGANGTEGRGAINEYTWTVLNNFPIKIDDMYDFNVLTAQNYTSPIMDALLKHYEKKDNRVVQDRLQATNVASVIDIEELFEKPEELMPPCWTRVMKAKAYKNMERVNLIPTLIDMGYTDRKAIVEVMCPSRNNNPVKQREIEAIYDSTIKKKKNEPLSVPCGTIINSKYDDGTILRCIYEEAKNGQQRKKHGNNEKDEFMQQCACTLGPSATIRRPLDFINIKFSQIR